MLSEKSKGFYQIIPYQKNNQELKSMDIQHIIFDNHNIMWLCTKGDGVAKFDGDHLQFFNHNNGFKASSVTSVCEDRSGNLWFASDFWDGWYSENRLWFLELYLKEYTL